MSCVNKSNKDYIRLAERYGDTIAESIVRTISKTKGLVEEFHIPSILEAKKFLKTANSNKLQKIKKGLKANPYLTEKGIVDYLQGVVSKFENQYYVVKGFSYGITSKEAAAKEIFEPNLEIVKTIASEYPDIFKIQETGKEQTVIVKITPKKQFLEIVTPPTIQQGKLLQEAGKNLATIPKKEIENLQSTVEYQLINAENEELPKKGGQSYVFLNKDDAKRFSYLLDKHKEFPKTFRVTSKITKYEKDPNVKGKFNGYNVYRDFNYVKANNNKKSNLYNIVDIETGEVVATKVRVLDVSKDAKSEIASKYGLEFTPTKVFNANRSIAFALYRQKPSKAKYIAQAKKYLYDAIKFLNPQDSNLKINLDQIEKLLESFPNDMWDYINTTYSPENSTNINASIGLQNRIKFKLPKLGLLTEIEKITGKKLQGVSFKNYDRSGGVKKVLKAEWGDEVVIDYQKMTTKQLRKAISYYLTTTGYFKPSSEEENVRKYAEHKGIDYEKLQKLVFGSFDDALEHITHNFTGNSDTIELSKWRESIREYDWQAAELFSKPYEDFLKTANERITEKFKDKTLSNGIPHLDYFFSGAFNWLNINFNNISGTYYAADMETESGVGVEKKMMGIINPFEMSIYTKPKAGENFLREEEVFNRLAAILHEPFHALHALSYGTKEERDLKRSFDVLYRTEFGRKMMEEVFGSGYNQGQQVSYDILYKEFTAFATQLMLYPKEWIQRTDLRSNDIYNFIEKIQTLQDKTYEEVIKVQQKIGTTERIVTEEEQIKLMFLEKLYNYIVKALNNVIPLSKKFFNIVPETRLVSKKVIEDVFGEVEETVTKRLELPKEVKKSKEEFLQAMDEFKSAINTLMQIDGKAFNSENVTNFFTSGSQYQEAGRATQEVKPGVQELFESNPELANAVYEAAGFSNPKDTVRLYRIENKNIPYDESREGIVSKKEIIGGFFTDNIDTVSNYIRKNQSQEGINLVYVDVSKSDLDKYHVSKNEYANTMDVESDNWIIPSNINRNYIDLSSVSKVTGNFMTLSKAKQELKSIIDNLPTSQITQEQKQQALQLYSQYLDTIFPDSKIKDIVYHVNKTGIISSEEGRKFYSTSSGSWLEELEEMKGTRIPIILNITNPTIVDSYYEFTDKAEKFRESGLGDEYVTPDEVRESGTDSVIGRDSGQGGNEKTYVTYSSNQVYQLGNKQDIEGFKEFVGKEEVELSPEEMYQKSLDLSDKEIEDRINKCRL